MRRELFGTDGIRGVANQHPMTAEVALQVGKAVARYLAGKRGRVVIGKDTRLSGYLFENALTAGLCAAGATTLLVGPLPTPAIAHITRSFAADAGIMITASHNPASHNGIKIFDNQGYKLSDEKEALIEKTALENLRRGEESKENGAIGKARRIEDARGRYIEFAKGTIKNASLKGLKICLDCANGAAYSVAPVILQELGAEVITLNAEPDGTNINEGCGALHPGVVATAVKEHEADAGIALDGDADRLIMTDEQGRVIDGSQLLALLATRLKRKERLAGETIVTTLYANSGLDEAMRAEGIAVTRVENGDRYVAEEMRKHGYTLGGEQSGHLILGEHATTGDGMIAALHILTILKEEGGALSRLARRFTPWPQLLLSVPVKKKTPIEQVPRVKEAVEEAARLLHPEGRVKVRYSGTEEKARIMIEAKGKREEELRALAGKIAAALRETLGEGEET